MHLIFQSVIRRKMGPSINDVSPKGEGGGDKKCPKRRRLIADLRRQGEGGYPKNLKFGETSFMDGLLVEKLKRIILILTLIKNLKNPK